MKKITIYLDDGTDTEKKLRYLAYKQEKSISQVIKDILAEKLKDVKVK